ncbi:MAG: PAS domain S-box protein [Gammaproteobacteria bacterium]|nr:PAS domain S-box protein [Gammaproteobacteria bacterium]
MADTALHALHAAGIIFMTGVIALVFLHPGRRRLSSTVRWVGSAVAGLAALAFLFALEPLSRFQMISEYIQAVLPMSWIFLLYACIEEDSRHQLTEERNRLQAVVSDIPVMIVAFDDDMNIALWNHEAKRVTGYDAETLTGSAELADLIDLLEEWDDNGDQAWRIQRYPDGQTRTVAWTRVPTEIHVPGWRIWAAGIDMTERETARAELLENRETLALAIEGSGAAVWTLHLPPELDATSADDLPDEMYMSPRLKAFIGYDDHEFPSSTSAWRDRIHPDDQPALDSVVAAHLGGEVPVHEAEYRIRHRDGSWRWISTRGKVRRDAGDNVIIWSGMDWDITEQKEATERLLASERRFRTLTESSPSGIWHVTPAGHTVYLNPAMADLLEIDDPAEIATETFHRFFPEESVERIRVEHEKRIAGVPSSYEADLVGRRGTLRHVMISAAPLLNESGGVQARSARLLISPSSNGPSLSSSRSATFLDVPSIPCPGSFFRSIRTGVTRTLQPHTRDDPWLSRERAAPTRCADVRRSVTTRSDD